MGENLATTYVWKGIDMESLYKRLNTYSKQDYYPFHMPGHKRQVKADFCEDPFSIDITEIEGFDNLHHAEDVIADAQERTARLYGAEESWFLVNGSTCGILAAISACTTFGGTLLMARNCHKAAYHAAYLRRLKLEYLFPEIEAEYGLNGGISPKAVKEKLEANPDIQAMLLTSPTYDGMVSDIEAIAEVAHDYRVPLIVDEAHGAHLGFHEYFPASAISHHADLVIQSLHKTMPALTQTALLHRNGNLVSRDKVQQFLGIYQTSSPSYVLMASMDACVSRMEEEKEALFAFYVEKLAVCRERLGKLQHLRLVPLELEGSCDILKMDPSKLLIHTGKTNIDGPTLYQKLLEEYHLQMEMEAPEYVLAMTSMMDTAEGYERLCAACESIERELAEETCQQTIAGREMPQIEKRDELQVALTLAEAMEKESVSMAYDKCAGKISAEYIYLYPPGIPLVVPGEMLTEELLTRIRGYQRQNLKVQGPQDETLQYLRIILE